MEQEPKTKQKLSTAKIIILACYAVTMLFIFTFGCYGCSYQPVPGPISEEEQQDILTLLSQTTWELDDTEGTPTFAELGQLSITELVFSTKGEEGLEIQLFISGMPPAFVKLVATEDGVFELYNGTKSLGLELSYSQSRNGSNEVIVIKGLSSDTRSYYLKI